MNWEIWAIAGLGLAAWFWWEGLQKREIAMRAARLACQRAGVQFLDETVSLGQLRPRRDDDQRMRLYRRYHFEFSDTGDNRLTGLVYLLGNRVLDVNLLLPAEHASSAAARDYPPSGRVVPIASACGCGSGGCGPRPPAGGCGPRPPAEN